jgi:hypothetical protein
LKKEILNDDFKKRKILWKNIAENFLEKLPYGKIFHLTSLQMSIEVLLETLKITDHYRSMRRRENNFKTDLHDSGAEDVHRVDRPQDRVQLRAAVNIHSFIHRRL